MAIGFVAIIVILNLSANPILPEQKNVSAIKVQYEYDAATVQTITDADKLETICSGMQGVKYKRSLKELLDDENEDLDLIITFVCDDGNTLEYLFFSDTEMAVKKGEKLSYYRIAKESAKIPYDASMDAMYDAKHQQALVKWQPFLDELYNSIYYSIDDGYINFCIPQEAPDTFSIRFDLKEWIIIQVVRLNR